MRRALAVLVPLLLAPAVFAQSLNPAFPGLNGPITASAVSGNTVYVAGGFTYAGPATGPGVPIDVTTVVTPATTARIEGIVYASVPDGAGGWYIGGAFTKVGAVSRANVAHIHSDGTIDNAWNPTPDGAVRALAQAGGLVYLGGDFQNVGASLRLRAAAVDA